MQSIVAAEIGHEDLAFDYFHQSLYLDLADTHGNTTDGVHIANAGGVWAALVHGFAGLVDTGEHLRFEPRLPADLGRDPLPPPRGTAPDIAVALDASGCRGRAAQRPPRAGADRRRHRVRRVRRPGADRGARRG